MAWRTKSQLVNDVTTNYNDNTTGDITPADLRLVEGNEIDSFQQAPIVNAQSGTSYTLGVDDYGKLVVFNNASPVAVSLPQATGSFAVWNTSVFNAGPGTVTITPAVSLIGGAATLVLAAGQGQGIVSDGVNYRLTRDLGGPFVKKSGDTMTGILTLSGAPIANLDAATKLYADGKVAKAGDTMTGLLTLSGAPTADLHAATKLYVDTHGGLTVNTTVITGGVSGNFLYNSAGVLGERTPTQATAALDLFSTTLTTKGLVPGSNNVGSTFFLNALGLWAIPAGGGTGGDVFLANPNVFTNTNFFNLTPGIIVGTNSIPVSRTDAIQIHLTSIQTALGIFKWSADANQANIVIGKSRGAAIGTLAATQSGDALGLITFNGVGTTPAIVVGAQIKVSQTAAATTIFAPSAITFNTVKDNTEALQRRGAVTSVGAWVIGDRDTPVSTDAVLETHNQVNAGSDARKHINAYAWSADTLSPFIQFSKSRGTTIGTHTAVTTGDFLGAFRFLGSDGAAFVVGANIRAVINGTVASGIVPTDLTFSTMPVGGTLTQRVVIGADGTSTFAGNIAAGAAFNTVQATDVASAATIDLDNVNGYVINITGTASISAVTLAAGRVRICVASGAFTLVNSASLILQGANNITAVSGDVFIFIGANAGNVRVFYLPRLDVGGGWKTYTPTVTAQTPGGTPPTFTVNTAKWSQQGKIAYVYTDITVTAAGTGTGSIFITLPVNPNNGMGFGRETALVGYLVGGQLSGAALLYTKYDGTTPITTGHRHAVMTTVEVA